MPKAKAATKRFDLPSNKVSAWPSSASIAARIRTIRRRKGVTLEKLAEMCSLDRGYLSRIERGQKTPSVATLLNIGEALGVQMSHLFGETVEPNAITVIRHNQYTPFPGPAGAKDTMLMITPESAARRASLVLFEPGTETTIGAAEHSGEEILFMLEGQAEVKFVDRNLTLSQGDCVHFDGHLKHEIRKVGHGRARMLVFV